MLTVSLTLVTPSPLITFPLLVISPRTLLLEDSSNKRELNKRTSTLMVPEEVMTKLWPEVPSPTSDLSTSSSKSPDPKPSISLPAPPWTSLMLLRNIKLMVNNWSSWLVRNTALVHPEIGLLRAPTSKVSRLLLLNLTKESTEATLLVWVSCPSNSRKVRMLTLLVLRELKLSTSPSTVVTLRLVKNSKLRPAVVSASRLLSDLILMSKSPTTRTVVSSTTSLESSSSKSEID
mmetsp:Transcript_26236/g.23092  ORF Transcript_26236/g.23092 Transcript_26236/m.23092 type:complete len:233 (+) Transcript_26236:809-1507(+)